MSLAERFILLETWTTVERRRASRLNRSAGHIGSHPFFMCKLHLSSHILPCRMPARTLRKPLWECMLRLRR